MIRLLIATFAVLSAAAALAAPPAPQPATPAVRADNAPTGSAARRGLAFARQRCAACHSVRPGDHAPNAEAPSFEAIANAPGVTRRSLRQFLRDSHNYPAAMDFRVDRARINDLSAYMITLQKADYRPDI